MSTSEPEPVVVPRTGGYRELPVVAIDERIDSVLDEDGTLSLFGEFVEQMPYSESCLVVAAHSARLLALMQRRWEGTPGWVSKCTRRERTMYSPVHAKHGITLGIANVVPHLCGWRRKSKRGKSVTFRIEFHFLDPDLFYASEKTVQDVFGPNRNFSTRKLMDWGLAVREFCKENDMPVRQTQGALGARFLTDPRFYPQPRRKVPKATNDRLRRDLPGNYSSVSTGVGSDSCFNGYYLDQRRAHHYHAQKVRLPCANSLFAYGDFTGLKRLCLDPSTFLGGGFHGVVAGDFVLPKRRTEFLPPGWRRRALSGRLVSTAEWPWLSDIGAQCTGLYAAWGSAETDAGIPAYSRYAESQLDVWEGRPMGATWLKPVLVSTYGALAVKGDAPFETLIGGAIPEFREQIYWDAGSERLYGYLMAHTQGNTLEPGTVNVLHRYMIEAATRTESVAFATHMQDYLGYRVLMIHVDAIIVEDTDKPLPDLLPDPWQLKSYLTQLTFLDDHSFEALEMSRLPGRPHLRNRKFVAIRKASKEMRLGYVPNLLPMVAE